MESQIAAGSVEPEKLERSIAAQIGYACQVSATEGRRRMRMARDLHHGHSHVRELFTAGELSEYRTSTIVAATAHLDADERAEVDQRLAEHQIETLSTRKLEGLARKLAAEVAPEKFLARCRAARTGRRVTVRPAADGMAYLTALLPVVEAVACYAALHHAATEVAVSPEPVTRSRAHIMADKLVERVTGQAVASEVNVEVQVLVPLDALLDPNSPLPAELPGYGPLPADLVLTGEGCTAWRRLITRDGVIIGGDSKRRNFDGNLARFIRARDGNRCTEPYCDAPIRHMDHIKRWSDGGRTEFDNGRALCEFHNYVREGRDWRVRREGNTITTTTPTGAEYTVRIGTTARKASTRQERRKEVKTSSEWGRQASRPYDSLKVVPSHSGSQKSHTETTRPR